MSVDLEPNELGFKRPFNREVSQVLRLSNSNSDPVAFKVKTTAPKQYCVRPNSGRIEAGQSVEVQVLLQAMKEDPPPDTRCRDKFLVQSVAIKPDSEAITVTQVWANVEQNAKSSVQERKIRVNFLAADAEEPSLSPGHAAGYSDEQPAYSTPSHASTAAPPSPTTDTCPDESTVTSMTKQATTAVAAAAASVAAVVPTSQADLQKQLDDAKTTISRLQEQASDGLRNRKPQEAVAAATENVKQTLQNAPAPGGVAIPIVALLCLICFLVAYFFF